MPRSRRRLLNPIYGLDVLVSQLPVEGQNSMKFWRLDLQALCNLAYLSMWYSQSNLGFFPNLLLANTEHSQNRQT